MDRLENMMKLNAMIDSARNLNYALELMSSANNSMPEEQKQLAFYEVLYHQKNALDGIYEQLDDPEFIKYVLSFQEPATVAQEIEQPKKEYEKPEVVFIEPDQSEDYAKDEEPDDVSPVVDAPEMSIKTEASNTYSEVVRMKKKGMSNKVIAEKLGLSGPTVAYHVKRAKEKGDIFNGK